MTVHLIVTCVAQKSAKRTVSILSEAISSDEIDDVFHQWMYELGKSNLAPIKAKDLYVGQLWNSYLDIWGLLNNRLKNTKLWVISAGHGFISGDAHIVPYNITFQNSKYNTPSIFAKIKINSNAYSKRQALRRWWELLISTNNYNSPNSISKLTEMASGDDRFILIAGKEYIDAVYDDLRKAINNLKTKENFIIISNNTEDTLFRSLLPNWLLSDKKFINLDNTNSTTINAGVAKKILSEMFFNHNGIDWWSINNFNEYLKQLAENLGEINRIDRIKGTDEEVTKYILNNLESGKISVSKLHRKYRDSGFACEYKRFCSLYENTLKNIKFKIQSTVILRPEIKFTKRDSGIKFFLPDWDDRVDPTYDFKNELTTLHRNPYDHDCYHYEIYGQLNCDGILISKSVLEDNQLKKNKTRQLGIHGYLRIPKEVPVLGDCGAFSYLMAYEPPYKTDEILNYYEEMGFDYGVSIDHLIVPAVLKKEKYWLMVEENWIEIDAENFKLFSSDNNTKIVDDRRKGLQKQIFLEGKLLCKESWIDEDEKHRRYDLTLKNGIEFISKHKKNKYSFIPIGAVQGWDPESYSQMAYEYEKYGFNYIALGGLVKSKTSDILQILELLKRKLKSSTKIHIFGVARPEAIQQFIDLGVTSVDNAGVLRQAWLSSSNNYYAPNFNNYTAIRIPQIDLKKAKETLKANKHTCEEGVAAEKSALESLRNYDNGEESLESTLEKVMTYSKMLNIPDSIYRQYYRTLVDKPWKKCECKICKDVGIDVIIFRGNNRNRRRGFHNTWVYYNWLLKSFS